MTGWTMLHYAHPRSFISSDIGPWQNAPKYGLRLSLIVCKLFMKSCDNSLQSVEVEKLPGKLGSQKGDRWCEKWFKCVRRAAAEIEWHQEETLARFHRKPPPTIPSDIAWLPIAILQTGGLLVLSYGRRQTWLHHCAHMVQVLSLPGHLKSEILMASWW